MSKMFPKLPNPMKDLPSPLRKRWKQLKSNYPKGVSVVGVSQQGNTWILYLTGGGQVEAGRVLLWE